MTKPWHSDSRAIDNRSEDTQQDPCLKRGFDVYDARVTINHWQLRDCVKPFSDDRTKATAASVQKVYYVFDHSIRSLEMKSGGESEIEIDDNSNIAGFSPSKHVVQFNFKPRCFTERNGLIACGSLIGSDDIGFPGNWNRLAHEDSSNSDVPISPPAEPIKLRKQDMLLNDKSHYSNPQIWKGILSLFNRDTGFKTSVILGQFINNCVTLYDRSNSQFDLYSCNNDGHLYQCNVSNRAIELVRRHADLKFSLNNSAISSDGRTLLVSGDSNKFAIYHRDNLAAQFSLGRRGSSSRYTPTVYSQPIPRYALGDTTCLVDNGIVESKNGDHGFYNAFSDNDLQFATLFQNGCCLVYDIRNLSAPLAEINSTRAFSHNGAFRVCKFSSGMDDLLFISEHQGRVHVVDTRDFNNHHVICLPNKPVDPQGRTSLNQPAITTTFSPVSSSSSTSSSSSASGAALPYMSLHSGMNAISGNRLTRDMLLKAETDYESLTTSALSMLPEYLEPLVVPYSKIVGGSTTDDDDDGSGTDLNVNRTYSSSTVSLSSSNMSSTLSLPSLQSASHLPLQLVQQTPSSSSSRRRTPEITPVSTRKSESHTYNDNRNIGDTHQFIIRRISTAYPQDQELKRKTTNETTPPSTDNPPSSHIRGGGPLHHHHHHHHNYSYNYNASHNYQRYQHLHLPPFTRELLFSGTQGYEDRIDRSLNHYNYTNYNDDIVDTSVQQSDENNISGIDWISDDTGGGSLLIGTDFGIVNWKIDSQARRSFASYDLC